MHRGRDGMECAWLTLGCFVYAYAWIDFVTSTGVIVWAWRVYAFVHVRSNLRVDICCVLFTLGCAQVVRVIRFDSDCPVGGWRRGH